MSLVSGLLQVFLILGSVNEGRYVNPEDSVLREARCKARCLSELEERSAGTHDPSALTLTGCQENVTCSQCLKPCGQTHTGLDDCKARCQDHESCLNSCLFLDDIKTNRPGLCPPAEEAVGFAAVCVEACTTDASCPARDDKCCDNGCGHTCQKAKGEENRLPARPYIKRIQELTVNNRVVVTWKPSAPQRHSVPLVHVLQSRQNPGEKGKEALWTEWETVKQTTQYSANIDDAILGYWYEFRVATVSTNGSVGFSSGSKALRLSRVPQPPSQPVNLTEGSTTVHDGKIDVEIKWLPPLTSDLPIIRYRVFWSERLSSISPVFVSLKEHRQSVSGNQNSYTIKNLKPDTTYFVEVQAICRYGRKKLRSRRRSFYITTYAIPTAPPVSERPTVFDMAYLDLPMPPTVLNLTVPEVYFSEGQLRAKVTWLTTATPADFVLVQKYTVHWVALVCQDEPQTEAIKKGATTHDTLFTLYDLEYSCHYEVMVRSVSAEGRQSTVTTARFYTPSCHSVKVKGDIAPNCPATPAPQVTMETETVRGMEGTSAILRCNVIGMEAPALSWSRKDGEELTASNHRLLDGALHILSLSAEDSGVYVCSAQNHRGQVATGTVTVIVEKPVLPPKPKELQHSFIITDGNITAHLTWKLPAPAPEDAYHSITGFQVSWGQRSGSSEGQGSSSTMTGATVAVSIPEDLEATFELSLADLDEGTVYVVQVQVLSTVGAGPAQKISFTTPVLNFNTQLQEPSAQEEEHNSHMNNKEKKDKYDTEHNFKERTLKSTSGSWSLKMHQSYFMQGSLLLFALLKIGVTGVVL
ncbi:anosmin-1 [Lingula anatina]|uniref:Anosmin-1 n=1 Tax=Lingula anatina TaxID=7574 RepID=A0A1S3H5D2_LINAN|nr:anosmin-1 [Lingula anatina]|eukprot:XP_013380671.1 anosmin-1 [Lingula anatina]